MPFSKTHWNRQHELMDDMMHRVGLDIIAGVSRGGFVDANCTCRSCQDHSACKEWLLVGAEILHEPPEFCPNLTFFAAAKRD